MYTGEEDVVGESMMGRGEGDLIGQECDGRV